MVKMRCFASLLRLWMSMLDSKILPMSLSSTAKVTLEHGTEPEGAVYPDSKPGDSNDCTFEVIFN